MMEVNQSDSLGKSWLFLAFYRKQNSLFFLFLARQKERVSNILDIDLFVFLWGISISGQCEAVRSERKNKN